MFNNCEKCQKSIFIKDVVDITKYIVLCKICKTKNKLYSKSDCTNLLLNHNDLQTLRQIYISNANTTQKLYDSNDIHKLINTKYGNMNHLTNIIKNKNLKVSLKKEKNHLIKEARKKELVSAFYDNKLDFYDYGDCYSYINYGKPSVDTIIKNELLKVHKKNDRRLYILNLIKNHNKKAKDNLVYNEEYTAIYEYINGRNNYSSSEIIRSIEVELFLRNNTDYLQLRDGNNEDEAIEKALSKYIVDNKEEKIIMNKFIVEFE